MIDLSKYVIYVWFLGCLTFSGNFTREDHGDLHAVLGTTIFPADLHAAFIRPVTDFPADSGLGHLHERATVILAWPNRIISFALPKRLCFI